MRFNFLPTSLLTGAALLLALTTAEAQTGSLGINTDGSAADNSALLDVKSTTQGVLVPRMSAGQRNAISSPATGLLVFQTDAPAGFYFYTGSTWTSLSSAGATGPQGAKGDKGDMGAAGLPGATGPQGNKGDMGLPGATGPQGVAGAAGPKGDTGPAGAASAKGDKGDKGDTGAAGPQGPAGTTGMTGAKGDMGAAGLAGATGPQGAKGDKGDAGLPGATGPQGAKGDAGQGVPTGGTAGQVLSKVDATNYNTQWTTPTGGGSGTYPSIELATSVNSSQAITPLAGSNTYTPLVFSSSNSANAALTGGNTWNGSVFTVGATGAGWYQFTVQVMQITNTGIQTNVGVHYYLDKNNAIGNTSNSNGTYPYALSTYNLNSSGGNYRFNSTIGTTIYLAAGDQITFRGQSISTSTAAYTSTDGSSNLTIVRLR